DLHRNLERTSADHECEFKCTEIEYLGVIIGHNLLKCKKDVLLGSDKRVLLSYVTIST
ncbi:unnamed protein product, partial [Mycena citricolor]